MNKPWVNTMTPLNSTNTEELITPSVSRSIIINPNPISNVPVIKRDGNAMGMNSQINNNNLNNIDDKISSDNTLAPTTSSNTNQDLSSTNQNISLNNNMNSPYGYGMNSSLGGSYGGMGMGGYGGGYGMNSGYGMGSYGGSYGGMGMGGLGGGYGMNSGYGMNRFGSQAGQENFLDQCFMIVERMNYQMYHFCEMTRMIQAQSASLTYFMEIITKVYAWLKTFITTKTKIFFDKSKLVLIEKLIKIKKYLKEFFTNKDVEDDKLKSHIKALDYMITLLLVGAVAGIFLKVY